MGIGLSGMVSGLDTDAIVEALMSTQRLKATKIENKITTNEWKTEKWKALNTKIYSLYTGSLYKMKTQGNYLAKRTASSNESIVTATASSSAAMGTHTVRVISTASSQYVTGGKAQKSGLNKNSKLSEAGVAVGTIVNIACGDKTKRLEVTEDTTINDFTSLCKDAGINASFDTDRNCFYLSSKESGKDNAFKITTETYNNTGLTTKQNLDELLDYSSLSAADQKRVDNALEILRSVDSTQLDAILAETDTKNLNVDQLNVLSAYNTVQSVAKESVPAKLALDDVYEEIRAMVKGGAEVYEIDYPTGAYAKLENDAKATAAKEWKQQVFEDTYKTGNVSDFADFDTEVTYEYITELEKKVTRMQNGEEVTLTAKEKAIWAKYTEADKKSALDTKFADMENDQNYKDGYENELNRLVEIDVKYYYNNSDKAKAAYTEKKAAYSAGTDADGKLATELNKLTTELKNYVDTSTTSGVNGLAALGLADIDGTAQSSSANACGMSVVAGADAEVEVDGAVYKADSNSLTVNGLTLDIKMANPGETVNVTISKDVDKVYDMVKEFVKQYNELLDEMNKAYNADSAYDYDPLTDEQKEAMSEKEIENWENKIKDSLLRRDNTLGSLINSMRTSLSGSVEVNGKRYSLSSFGICTTDYTEKGKLHIYGDADDSAGAMYDDKLRAALEEDPDAVMEVLQGLSEDLYNTMADKMKSTSLSSALTFYNDKQMSKELTTYKKELASLEDRLASLEDRYYKQFTAMEKALSNLNNSANSLASMLGMSTTQ